MILVEVTEYPIERPKKPKILLLRKRKYHTIKTQIIVNAETREIIVIVQSKGTTYDFLLYKQSIGKAVRESIQILVDSGYQGIKHLHANSEHPKKKSKLYPLTTEDKKENQRISRERILIENINAKVKTFKSMGHKYCNRRKRHLLRTALILGIITCFRIC